MREMRRLAFPDTPPRGWGSRSSYAPAERFGTPRPRGARLGYGSTCHGSRRAPSSTFPMPSVHPSIHPSVHLTCGVRRRTEVCIRIRTYLRRASPPSRERGAADRAAVAAGAGMLLRAFAFFACASFIFV